MGEKGLGIAPIFIALFRLLEVGIGIRTGTGTGTRVSMVHFWHGLYLMFPGDARMDSIKFKNKV